MARNSSLTVLTLSACLLFGSLTQGTQGEPLPTSYSLYAEGSLLDALQQGKLGTCWAFASTTTLQSALLHQGIITDRNSPHLNISEWHLAATDGNFLSFTAVTEDDRTYYPGWGAFNEFAVAYWVRGMGQWELKPEYSVVPAGGGPVLVSEHPLNVYPLEVIQNYGDLSTYVPPTYQPIAPVGIKRAISYFWDPDVDSLEDYQQQIKEALQNYGAVASAIYATKQLRDLTSPENEGYTTDGTNQANHAITIVGWDDEKVLVIDGETYVGAWLVQNNWGTDWGTYAPGSAEKGYFWVPYANTSMSDLKIGIALVPRSNEYRDGKRLYSPVVLQNQIFSPFMNVPENPGTWALLTITGFQAGTRSLAASKLSAPGGFNNPSQVTLAALGLWQTDPGTTVTITIYPEWGQNGPEGTSLLTQTVTLPSEGKNGYNEIDLDTEITLKLGQSVYVVVDFGDEYDYPIAVDAMTIEQLAGNHNFIGLSWLSSNGIDWDDLATSLELPSIFFLKGVTIFTPLPSTGEVSGMMQTYGSETVPELVFENGSELYTNGPITATSGSLTVASGTADLRGNSLITSGNLTYTGPGTLLTQNPFEVGGNVSITSGHFSVGNLFLVQGDEFVIHPGASVEVAATGWLLMESAPHGGTLLNRGTLSGIGEVYANVHNHGVLVPGQSPGMLHITGNFVQGSDGTYLWEAENPGNYDKVSVSGSILLDGTLSVRSYNGYSFSYGDKFKGILTGEKVDGKFRGTQMPSGLRARLFYKPTSVDLLIAPQSYTQLASTPSERSLAKALDRFIPATKGDQLTVSLALDHLRAEEYPYAFRQIAPHFYNTVIETGLTLATEQSRLVNQRLDAIRDGSTGLSLQGFGLAPVYENSKQSKEILNPAPNNRWGVWAQANGIFGRNGSVGDLPNDRFNSGGITVGFDYRWSARFSTGLFGGYHHASSRDDDGSRLSLNGGSFGLYATAQPTEAWYVNLVSMASRSHSTVRRSIDFGSIDRNARSDFDSWSTTTLLETGYEFGKGAFRFGPIVNLQYSYFENDSLQERNAGSLSLAVDRHGVHSLQSGLGARASYLYKAAPEVLLVPELRFYWNYEWLKGADATQAWLQAGSGPAFTTYSPQPERNRFTTGAGVSAFFGTRWNASAYYNAAIGSRNTVTHSVTASVGMTF